MSIIFGARSTEGDSISVEYLLDLARATSRYAPNGTFVRSAGRIGIGYQPNHTHARSPMEGQPAIGRCGNILSFDGRLDNCRELQRMLDIDGDSVADSFIVLTAFERWGERCFARFVGDWALALWSPRDSALYLARDHAGSRTLYYESANGYLLWSTHLETFFHRSRSLDLDNMYAARYLAGLPLHDLTPFRTIRSVPLAHYLKFRDNRVVQQAHWQWMIDDRIHYRSDEDYEAHFLTLFSQSVERRTGTGGPILAELSGGIDSTSIVCMSDVLRCSHENSGSVELIDTLSLFNDSEPAWDEKPYFSLVEARRGKVGIHINTENWRPTFEPPWNCDSVPLLPGMDSGALQRERNLENRLREDYRVVISGIGGDELLGGVPFPMPELADLLITCHLGQFLRRAVEWCLIDRSPLFEMAFRTAAFLSQIYIRGTIGTEAPPEWMTPAARELCAPLRTPFEMNRRIGLRPSTIENGWTWWFMLESLPHLVPAQEVRREYRYPYLDRDLVEFLFRVPREKLLDPGRRRKLMRNALRDIVPAEILERKRKAYVIRKPLISLQGEYERILALFTNSLVAEHGLVAPSKLRRATRSVCDGREPHHWRAVMRYISLELWLRAQAAVPSPGSTPSHDAMTVIARDPARIGRATNPNGN